MTLTLSVAYLTVLNHQRNREQQGAALRAQALAISHLIDPLPAPLPPTRSEIAAAQRATSVEVAKDRWNQEISNVAHWVQSTDWDEVREGLEASLSNLWTKAAGETPAETLEDAKEKLAAATRDAKAAAAEKSRVVAATARNAYEQTKEKGEQVELSAEDAALEARLRGKQSAAKAEEKAAGAKSAIASALESGRDKAVEIVNKAKEAVGAAEDKVGVPADGKVLPGMTAVQKALHQRYQRPEAKHTKTVAEALQERYKPMEQRDNTVLRGV